MIKLDIITGFLGAGKTTFINELLSELKKRIASLGVPAGADNLCTDNSDSIINRGEKVACLVNDFGEQPIDNSLIGGELLTLGGGCVCCTLKNDFFVALQTLASAKPDRIIFEPSGLFLLTDLLNDLKLSGDTVKINSIIAVVDCQNFDFESKNYFEFISNQLEYATAALLTKARDKQTAAEISEKLSIINCACPIFDSSTELIDFIINNDQFLERDFMRAAPHFDPETYSKILSGEMTKLHLNKILISFKQGIFGEILRAKAIISSGGKKILLSVVNNTATLTEISVSDNLSRAAFIGKNLNKTNIDKLFN